MKTTTLTIIALFFAVVFPAFSTTYYVRSDDGTDTNDGLSVASAFQTLDKVFSLTLIDGDIIDISGTFDYYVGKTLTKSITIQGTNKATAIIRGLAGSKKRCFGIGDANNTPSVTFENITFQDFDYFDDATSTTGGILQVAVGSELICRDVNFINSQAYSGGAVNIAGGTVVFEDCYFYGNKSKRRTGATNADGGVINVSIANTSSADISLTINRCLFENNSTENIASAVRFRSETTGNSFLLIQNSTFFGNTVKTPSTSNTAGAIYLDVKAANSVAKLINNTIAFNTSEVNNTAARAGISIAGSDDKISLINNILYSNTNAANTNISISASTKLKEAKNNITNQAYNFTNNTMPVMDSDNISSVTEEQLGMAATLAENGGGTKTLSINATSVAINAGYVPGAPAVDQRNITRVGTPDVGAYENTTTTVGNNVIHKKVIYIQNVNKTTFTNISDFNRVTVYNSVGQQILTEKLSGNNYELISNRGLHLVVFEGMSGNEVVKLMLN